MQEPGYAGLLFGDLSAITQVNRVGTILESVIQREEWQPRLLNGSDYPLPGVLPLFSLKQMVRRGFITRADADVLSAIRLYNPLLFDFALKRTLRINQSQFGPQPFQTRDFFNSPDVSLVT